MKWWQWVLQYKPEFWQVRSRQGREVEKGEKVGKDAAVGLAIEMHGTR